MRRRIAPVSEGGAHRQYGTPYKLGNGMIRTYVVLDEKNEGRPLEVRVAMSEQSLEGLPGAAATADHMKRHNHSPSNSNVFLLDLPAKNPTPYKFVQFDWNPNGQRIVERSVHLRRADDHAGLHPVEAVGDATAA